ncbi:MAG: hypothetical protein ACKN9T_06375 [Candidatus Methylumidiphilus sp.]
MYTIELDAQTETLLARLAQQEGKEPAAWIRDKLVNLIQSPTAPSGTAGDHNSAASTDKRIGVAKGLFTVPDDIDGDNAAIAQWFNSGFR